MVVVSGIALVTGAFVCLVAGGGGLFAILRWANGGEEFPSILNSSFGFAQWEHHNNKDLIGLNFDFESGGILFEVGMIAMGFFIVFYVFAVVLDTVSNHSVRGIGNIGRKQRGGRKLEGIGKKG